MLPRTNCGDCGQATCLAFATRVIKEGEDLSLCPYLSAPAQEMAAAVQRQQEAGLGRRRESVAISREVMHDKVAALDFAKLAVGLGAVYGKEDHRPYLTIPYFGKDLQVFKDEVRYPPGVSEDPWDAILLYNYIASQGGAPLTGKWITFKELPNSVSKAKTLARLEGKLADWAAGGKDRLRTAAAALGGEAVQTKAEADLDLVFWPLPRTPIRLLFWDAEGEEGFRAQAHFLFDASVAAFLDLESILFLVEKLLDRLMD